MTTETATLAGGCFWCLEAVYELFRGVTSVKSGYTGGHVPNPTYAAVCTGTTRHAEAVQVEFDPEEISFRDLLDVFFTIHDPTTLNQQGADIGTQYRSAIYTHSDEQRATAQAVIEELNAQHLWPAAIVTEVTPLDVFYPAEEYHAQYYQRNPEQGYCRAVIEPKVAKARSKFFEKLAR